MMKKIALSLLLMILVSPMMAQEEIGFTSDRPGATESADVLPKGRLQLETCLSYEIDRTESIIERKWTFTSSMLRWGFSDFAELRVTADYLYVTSDGQHNSGLSDIAIGTKMRLFKGEGLLPSMSMIANVLVPDGDEKVFLPKDWGGELSLALGNQLTSALSLSLSSTLTWRDDTRPIFLTSIGLSYDLFDQLSLSLDEYNYNTRNGTDSFVEFSVGWMVAPRLQLDLGADILLNDPANQQNIFVGLAWQITKK